MPFKNKNYLLSAWQLLAALNLLHIKARVGGEGGGGVAGADPALLRAVIPMAVWLRLGGMRAPVGKVSKSRHTSTAVEAISCFLLLSPRLPGGFGYCGQGSGRVFGVCSLAVHGGCRGSSLPRLCVQVADLICFPGREKQDLAPLFPSSPEGIVYLLDAELQTSPSGLDHQHFMPPLLLGQRMATHFSREEGFTSSFH